MNNSEIKKHCLVCETPIEAFMSFGRMPIANGFLMPDQVDDEYFFNLQVGFCPRCAMVQLMEHVDLEMLFHDEYAFFSSPSTRMAELYREFAASVESDNLSQPAPSVVMVLVHY